MMECKRQRVGGVGGLGDLGEAEHPGDHPLDLLFRGGTRAGDGQLDLVGRVLHDRALGVEGRSKRKTGGLAHTHCGPSVGLEEDPLHDNNVGTVFGYQRPELRVHRSEPGRQLVGGRRSEDAVAHTPKRSEPTLGDDSLHKAESTS